MAPARDDLTIGALARAAGVAISTLRFYERRKLVLPSSRTNGDYRLYTRADVSRVRFIKRARDLGFSMDEIGELVGLWQNRRRASANVRRIAQKHADELGERIAQMQAMQRSLQHLIHCCSGDDRPDCPILDDLAAGPH